MPAYFAGEKHKIFKMTDTTESSTFSRFALENAELLENKSTVDTVPTTYPLFTPNEKLTNFECKLILLSYLRRIKTHAKMAESNRRELVPERKGAPWTLSVNLIQNGSQEITVAIIDRTELKIITQPPNTVIVRFRCGFVATFTQGKQIQGLETNNVTFEFKRLAKKNFKASTHYYVIDPVYKKYGQKVLDNVAFLGNKALYKQIGIGTAAAKYMQSAPDSWGEWNSKFWEPLVANELTLSKFNAKTPAKGIAAKIPNMWYARDPIAVLLKKFSVSVDTNITEAIVNLLGDCELALKSLDIAAEGELAHVARMAAAGGLPFPSGNKHYVRDCAV